MQCRWRSVQVLPAPHSFIHRSERGSRHTIDDFRDEHFKHGIQCSTSTRGNRIDDAMIARSFWGYRKENASTACATGLETRRGPMFSITSRCSPIEAVATAISASSVQRQWNLPHPEAHECLRYRGKSSPNRRPVSLSGGAKTGSHRSNPQSIRESRSETRHPVTVLHFNAAFL